MTINKRAGRSIKKNIAFYIISIILTMLTSMVIVAAVSTGHTLTKVVDDFVKNYKTEDAEFVTYQPLSDADMEKLEQEYDVILEYSRYKDITVESGDLKGATIRVFPMPEKLNLCEVRDGHEPGDGEALLTQDFADVHDIKVGDTISLGAYDYKVSAYTTKADYIYMLEKLSGYIDSEKFALIVVDCKEYDKIDADETSYYSIKYNKDNSKEVREKLNEDYVIASYMAATTNTRISMPVNDHVCAGYVYHYYHTRCYGTWKKYQTGTVSAWNISGTGIFQEADHKTLYAVWGTAGRCWKCTWLGCVRSADRTAVQILYRI